MERGFEHSLSPRDEIWIKVLLKSSWSSSSIESTTALISTSGVSEGGGLMSETESYGRYLARGGAVIFISQLAAGTFALFLRILLARSLSVEEYGIFYAAFYFVSFFALFRELGLTSAIVKFLPEFLVRKNRRAIVAAIRFVLLLQIVIVGLISSVILILSPQIASGFVGDERAAGAVRILAVWLFVSIFYSTLLSVFQGLKDMTAYGWVNAGWDALLLISTFLLLRVFSLGVSGAALAYVLGTVFISLLSLAYLTMRYRNMIFSRPAPIGSISRVILSFSIPVFIGGIWGMVMGYVDTWAVTIFRGTEEVGYYQVAQPTARFLFYFASSVTIPLFPMVSELWARGRKALLSKSIHFILKFSFIAIMPFVLVFLTFPDIIIRILFGERYLAGVQVLQIFSIVVVFSLLYKIFGTILAGLGKAKLCATVSFIICIVCICANVILVPVLGMVGAALSILLAHGIGSLLYGVFLRKHVSFSPPVSPMVKTVAGSILTLLLISVMKSIIVLPVFAEAVVVVSVSFLFYAGWVLVTKALSRDDLIFLAKVLPVPRRLLSLAGKCLH
jgi:stage V sporulation protein B